MERKAQRAFLGVTFFVTSLVVALGVPLTAAAQDGDLRAAVRLEPDDVLGLDEIAVLEIEVSAEGRSNLSLDPVFELDNFRLVGGPSQSTSLQFINGRSSTSRSFRWQLKPRRLGEARVHSLRVEVDGRTIELEDREVEVVREPPSERSRQQRSADPLDRFFNDRDSFFDSPFDRRRRPRREARAPEIFLRAEAEPARPYVGQQVIYRLHLYTQAEITSYDLGDLPDFKGFWKEIIPQPERINLRRVTYQGESLGHGVLLERALFPRRAGGFEIEPIKVRLAALLNDSGPFGSLMPRRKEILRESNPLTIEVRELPPSPPGFTDVVGEIELEAGLEPRTLAVGEAATLTLRLQGRGHLQGVAAPEIPEIPGLEVFPPQQQSDAQLRGKYLYGTRTWSFVLVPERAGTWEVPPIEVPYFDPGRGEYRVAATEALELEVEGTASVAQNGAERRELHPIRTAALPAVEAGWHGLPALAPYLFVLPWAVAGLVLLWRRRGVGAAAPARQHFKAKLQEAAAEERPRQSAALIEEAWRDFLDERWQIPPGIPSPRWGNELAARGVAEEHAEALVRLADDLHYLRYAPKLSAVDELRGDLVVRSRKLLKAVG